MQSKASHSENQEVLDKLMPKWLAGEIDRADLPDHYPWQLRINAKDGTVETSHGGAVNLEHAKAVLPKVIEAIKGNTRLDFAVGCTQFQIEQVLALAEQLNATPTPAPDTAKV